MQDQIITTQKYTKLYKTTKQYNTNSAPKARQKYHLMHAMGHNKTYCHILYSYKVQRVSQFNYLRKKVKKNQKQPFMLFVKNHIQQIRSFGILYQLYKNNYNNFNTFSNDHPSLLIPIPHQHKHFQYQGTGSVGKIHLVPHLTKNQINNSNKDRNVTMNKSKTNK